MNFYSFNSKLQNIQLKLAKYENGIIYFDINQLENIFSISFEQWMNLPENAGLTELRSIMFYEHYNYKSPEEFEKDFFKEIDGKLYCAYNHIISYIKYNNEKLRNELYSFSKSSSL